MSDLENESEETGARFNKAIIGRVFAVALFVALGTFAVVQSMRKKPDPEAQISQNENESDLANNTKKVVKAGLEKSKQLVSGVGTTANNFKNSAANAIQKSTDAFKPKTGFNPASNTALKPSTLKPKVVKPTSQAMTQAPKAKVGDRFALASSSVPIITSQGGFGTRDNTQFPKTPSTGTSFNPKPIVSSFGDAGKNLANKAKSATDDLLKKANQKVTTTGETIRNNIGFGPSKSGAPSVNPSPFKNDLPVIKSGFGNTPTTTGSTNRQPIVSGTSIPQNNIGSTRAKSNAAFDTSRKLAPINSPKTNSNVGVFEPLKSSTSNSQVRTPSTNRSFNTNGFGAQPKTSPPTNPIVSKSSTGSQFGQNRETNNPQRPAFPQPNQRNVTPAKSVSTFSTNRAGSSTSVAPNSGNIRTKNIPGERQLEGVQAPALTIEKLSPREIQVNQPADFQLVIKNVGRVSAEDVRVFDKVPNGTELIGASPEPGNNRSGDLQWNIGKLRPGQEKRIKIQLRPIRHGEIGSVAHVTFATQASMRTLVTKPVLDIVHQAKSIHLIGDEVVFDITVQNKGDGPATNVLIQEDVPSQLEFQDGSNGIEYEIGTLMPGQSKRLQLSLKAAKIGKLRNIMFASADGGLEAKHELPLEVVAPNLVASTDGPKIRYLQRNVTHDFSVVNNGTAPATNVELIARLPSGLRFVSANNQGRYDSSAHSVYWSLAELARDVKAGVELKTMPVEIGSQPIKFETFADLEVRSSIVQPLNVEHLVDVFFDIDDVVDPIEIGSDTSYKIRVVNQGTKAATNVQLKVQFPNGLAPTSVDGSIRHQIAGQQVLFEPISSMSPGDEISVVVHGKGQGAGDHRVVVHMTTDGRMTPVSKEETTRVYSDR